MELFLFVFKELIKISIIASIAGVAIFIMNTLFKKIISPKILSLIWCVFIVLLIIPVRFQSEFSIYNLFKLKEVRYEFNYKDKVVADYSNNLKVDNNIKNKFSESSDYSEEKYFNVNGIFTCLFALYIFILLIKVINFILINRKINKYSLKIKDKRLTKILEKEKCFLKIDKDIELVSHELVSAPAISGIINPKIYVCEGITKLDDSEIEMIFLHELCHLKNGDLHLNLLLNILKMVYFFNPVVLRLIDYIRKNIELTNDEYVVNYLENKEIKKYCNTLVKVLAISNGYYVASALGISNGAKDLEGRIKNIKMSENFIKNKLVAVLIVATIVLGVTICFASDKVSNESDVDSNNSIDNNVVPNELKSGEDAVKRSKLVSPLDGKMIMSSDYSKRTHPITKEEIFHTGIDLVADKGETVKSIADGVVSEAGYNRSEGYFVEVMHELENGKYYSRYAHLSKENVDAGDSVSAGDKIGEVGSTGMATGPHLHFEIRNELKEPINPNEIIEIRSESSESANSKKITERKNESK